MDTVAVFVDDADYAARLLGPMQVQATHWVLVACAPRLTHRIGKYVSHSSREQWRERWTAKLFARLQPQLAQLHGTVETMLARQPLPAVVDRLIERHGMGLRLLDARRPKLGAHMEPLPRHGEAAGRWVVPMAVSGGSSVVLALVD
jgi:hypothetical protein